MSSSCWLAGGSLLCDCYWLGLHLPCRLESTSLPPIIGFCFSFAVDQTAMDNGKLLLWTKVSGVSLCAALLAP